MRMEHSDLKSVFNLIYGQSKTMELDRSINECLCNSFRHVVDYAASHALAALDLSNGGEVNRQVHFFRGHFAGHLWRTG